MGAVRFARHVEPLRSTSARAEARPTGAPAKATKERQAEQALGLAEGKALKERLWLPGQAATLVERDTCMEAARLLTARALNMPDVCLQLVRCSRFGDEALTTVCTVCGGRRILGCYELTDSLGGVLFRRMTDAVCRELAGTLGPLPGGRYNPINSFQGSRRFPSGLPMDAIAAYVHQYDPTALS